MVLSEESSNRCVTGAKSRVKPAKMLMLRSRPRTSEMRTVVSSAGKVVEGDVSWVGGMTGPRFGVLWMRGRWGGRRAVAVSARDREWDRRIVYRIMEVVDGSS